MDAQVVVKTLALEDLGRDADKVFTEAQVLRQLEHPAIIRISECGYVDAVKKSRPYLLMDYFQGATLEEYVKKNGPLSADDLIAVSRQVADGLHAAHAKGILHRDVKPANLLVYRGAEGWKVKVIDFGLALRQKVVQKSTSGSTSRQGKTLIGESIAGTVDYAAPEQMGKREGVAPGPYSDVYGWAKTCCYALFRTTQPLMKHWKSVPTSLAELLEKCLDEDPEKRPQGFADVLAALDKMTRTSTAVAAAPRPARPDIRYVEAVAKAPRRRAPAAAPERPAWMLPLLIGGGVVLVFLVCGGGLILLVANRVPTPGVNNGMQPTPLPGTPPFINDPKPAPAAESSANGFGYNYRIDGNNYVLVLTNRKADFTQGQLTLTWTQRGTAPGQTVYPIASWKVGAAQELLIPRNHHPTNLKLEFRLLMGTSTYAGTIPLPDPPAGVSIPPFMSPPSKEATPGVAPDDAPGLIALLESEPPFRPHFVAAMDALVKLKDEKGAEALAHYLADRFHSEDAARGLRAMGPIAEKAVAGYINNKDAGVRERAASLIKGYGTKPEVLLDAVIADLNAPEAESRKAACAWLSNTPVVEAKQKEVARGLDRALADSSPFGNVRQAAARAEAVWGDKDSVPALLAAMNKDHSDVWQQCVDALVALKDERAVMPLILETQNFFHKEAARKALIDMGPLVETALDNIVSDTSAPTSERIGACQLLANPAVGIGSAKSLPALTTASKDANTDVKKTAAAALAVVKKRS